MGRLSLSLLLLLMAPASGDRGRRVPFRLMTLPSPGGDRTIYEELEAIPEDIPENIPEDISEDVSEDDLDDTPSPLPPLPPHEFLKREHTWTSGANKGETSVFVILSAPPYKFTCQGFKTTYEDDKALDKYDFFQETWPLAEDHIGTPSGFSKIIA